MKLVLGLFLTSIFLESYAQTPTETKAPVEIILHEKAHRRAHRRSKKTVPPKTAIEVESCEMADGKKILKGEVGFEECLKVVDKKY